MIWLKFCTRHIKLEPVIIWSVMLTRLFYEEDDMMHLKQMPAQDKYNLKSRIKYKHKFHALATYMA